MALHEEVVKDLKGRIESTLEGLRKELAKSNRAREPGNAGRHQGRLLRNPHAALGMCGVGGPEPRMITIKPWDKGVIKKIEKSIREANLGLNPMNDGEMVRLPIPPLTEERRKDIAKQVRSKGEEHRVAIRNERRDANEKLKVLQKDKQITEDEQKRAGEKVQKETDGGVTKVDEIITKKEKEVMEV